MADASENIKNIKESQEVKSGDKFIIETDLGTRILDFDNLIIGTDNVTFYDTITGNTTDVTNLSAEVYDSDGLKIRAISADSADGFSYFAHETIIGGSDHSHDSAVTLMVSGGLSGNAGLSGTVVHQTSSYVTATSGLFLFSPNGTRFALHVTNAGTLIVGAY